MSGYIGVENKARKIKKGYIGVENKARKVKKGYMGVGGVARPFFSEGGVEYFGTLSTWAEPRSDGAAANTNSYALFGGGDNQQNVPYNDSSAVVAYNSSLTRFTTMLIAGRSQLSAAKAGNNCIFYGGQRGGMPSGQLDVFTDTLSSMGASMSTDPRGQSAAITVGNHALFGGGYGYGYGPISRVVEAISSSLVKSKIYDLSEVKSNPSASAVGGSGIFAGGWNGGGWQSSVDAYSASLVKTILAPLTSARDYMGAITIGDNTLFGGGRTASGIYSKIIEIYNGSLVKGTPIELSETKYRPAVASFGEYGMFAGGTLSPSPSLIYSSVVDIFDRFLTRTAGSELSTGRTAASSASIGNYSIIAGGRDLSGKSGSVDVYTLTD